MRRMIVDIHKGFSKWAPDQRIAAQMVADVVKSITTMHVDMNDLTWLNGNTLCSKTWRSSDAGGFWM